MKKIITLSVFLIPFLGFSQTKALTDEGKEVILFDNGTWKFVNESDSKTLETISNNPTIFEKHKDASFLFKSKKINVGLYINPKKWNVSTQNVSQNVEYFFTETDSSNSLYGFLMSEKIQIATLKNLKDIILESVQKRVDYFRLKESEYRTVNGLKVLYLRYAANIKGIDFEYAGNYYINDSGYCGIVGFCSQKDFEENFPKISEFLNGISLAQKQEITETIEYTSPPPPMTK